MELVKDTKYEQMWRIKYDDGTFSDMYNKTRAKEHMRRLSEQERKNTTED